METQQMPKFMTDGTEFSFFIVRVIHCERETRLITYIVLLLLVADIESKMEEMKRIVKKYI